MEFVIIKNVSNFQVFLDQSILKNLDISAVEVQSEIASKLLEYEGIEKVLTRHQLLNGRSESLFSKLVQNGFNQKRSGDVFFVLNSGYIPKRKWGTDHGSSFVYDTHVPLLFFGNGVNKGETLGRTEVSDIAPTVASMLGIAFPSGTTGTPIAEVLE